MMEAGLKSSKSDIGHFINSKGLFQDLDVILVLKISILSSK